jgi:hypothetical protein
MATQTQPRTAIVETLTVNKDLTIKKLTDKLGRPLGSPINGYNVDEKFTVTLTGKIEIREFQGVKGAYFTTKEGISVKVNASFDPAIHKEGAKLDCVCREFPRENGTPIKFAAFVNN